MAVGIDKEVLEKYSRYPSEECIVEMLDYWLKNHHSKPTWKNVAEALKDIGLHRYAEKMLEVYETGEKIMHEVSIHNGTVFPAGKLPVEVDMHAVPQLLLPKDNEETIKLEQQPPLPPKLGRESSSSDTHPPILPPKSKH